MNLISTRSRHYHVTAFDHIIDDMNAQGIEHVLCTGDVTNLALEREFKFARDVPLPRRRPAQRHGDPRQPRRVRRRGHRSLRDDLRRDYHRADAGWEWTEADADGPDDDLHSNT